MTAFIITSMILFLISIISNIAYIINPNTIFKGAAATGLIFFSAMVAWSIFLLIS
jgi:hypothetical protein